MAKLATLSRLALALIVLSLALPFASADINSGDLQVSDGANFMLRTDRSAVLSVVSGTASTEVRRESIFRGGKNKRQIFVLNVGREKFRFSVLDTDFLNEDTFTAPASSNGQNFDVRATTETQSLPSFEETRRVTCAYAGWCRKCSLLGDDCEKRYHLNCDGDQKVLFRVDPKSTQTTIRFSAPGSENSVVATLVSKPKISRESTRVKHLTVCY